MNCAVAMSTVTETQAGFPQTRTPPPEALTYEQFLAWADEDTHAEWVNGKVVFMSPVSREHAQVTKFLLKLVDHFVGRRPSTRC